MDDQAPEGMTYEEGARQSPLPRSAIANSVERNVRDSLKDKPEEMVERAVLQARQEADLLYNLVVDLNVCVQSDFLAINREYGLFLGMISALFHSALLRVADYKLKELTLFFVKRIFVLEGTISRLSVEQLGGQQVLFVDSAQKLAEVVAFAEKAVDHFNFIAREIGCPPLDNDEIRKNLQAEIDQQVARTILVARGAMLGLFGEDSDLRANYDQVIAVEKPRCPGESGERPGVPTVARPADPRRSHAGVERSGSGWHTQEPPAFRQDHSVHDVRRQSAHVLDFSVA